MFIAMVLVAAITAGVLVNTAGLLQSQAESTGQESIDQVSNGMDVYTTVGTVDDGVIRTLNMTVSLGPGSDPVDLEKTTLEYLGPDGQASVNDPAVDVHGTSSTVLETASDRGTITFDVGSESEPLEAGESATLTITTADGVQRTEEIFVPTILEDGETVQL